MMTVRKDFDHGLEQLNEWLVEMGEQVEKAIDEAVVALSELDSKKAKMIYDHDYKINEIEGKIVELGLKLIATQQPVAKDLRRIIAAFRIASDLERMGDLARDVAKAVMFMEGQTLIKPIVDITRMGEIIRNMTYEGIQAFIHENVDLAYKMAKDDDHVDELFSKMLRDLQVMMTENTRNIPQAHNLSFVGRYMERFGDHATNIAESVVYLVTSKKPDLNG